MSESFAVLASDGLLEFETADIEEIATDASGTHVRLKDGHTCSLVGHEASGLMERLARELRAATV
jgi:hypothetical protein